MTSESLRLETLQDQLQQDSTDAIRRLMEEAQSLTNEQLTSRVVQLNRHRQLEDAELLWFLSELDERKLYRNLACSSMFEFLTARLGQSEDVAYRWMWGARLMRAFPLAYDLLAHGRLHLSGLILLKPHLTQENHRDWLLAAAGKSKRAIERLVATRCPKADVPTQIRRLPQTEPTKDDTCPELACAVGAMARGAPVASASATLAATPTSLSMPPAASAEPREQSIAPIPRTPLHEPRSASLAVPSRPTKVQPLSQLSYRVVFTASERLKQKLQRAGELLSHAVNPNDLPALLERAVDLLIEREEKRRYGSSNRRVAALTTVAVTASLATGSESAAAGAPASPATGSESAAEIAQDGGQAPNGTESSASSRAIEASTHGGPPNGAASGVTEAAIAAVPPNETKENVAMADAPTPAQRSRYLPAELRRQVWERDAGQCTYVDREGRRCQSRHFLEFDHRVAQALDGGPTLDNIRLRCRCHNALAAEQVFGVKRIADAISSARHRRCRTGATRLGF